MMVVEAAPRPKPPAFAAAERLAASARLRRRRFAMLPVLGPGSILTEVQGRAPGAQTSVTGLAELISSIGEVGVLQPILVEELPGGTHRLVAGERRLRACRIGAVDNPENPHFQQIPAVLCPGPLDPEDRATWQLIENLARSDLSPGDLAQALLFERCAMLTVRLEEVGAPPPAEILAMDDPLQRWYALNRFRTEAKMQRIGAPWAEVVRRIGLHLSEDRIEQIIRAFARLPADVAEEMDREGVAINARLAFVQLASTKEQAAGELWDAVRSSNKGKLLYSAVRELMEHPGIGASAAVERAEARLVAANESRAEARRKPVDAEDTEDGSVDPSLVKQALADLGELSKQLGAGKVLSRYDAGSMRLYLEEIGAYLRDG